MFFKQKIFLRYVTVFIVSLVLLDLLRLHLFECNHYSDDGEENHLTAFLPDPHPIDVHKSYSCFDIEDLLLITKLPKVLSWIELDNQSNKYISSPNPIHLITQWYHEQNHRRRRELLTVLQMNLLNDAVTSIHFIQYSKNCTVYDDIMLDPNFRVDLLKLKLIISYQTEVNETERLTVSKALKYANGVISRGYAVVLNLDIFFDRSLNFLQRTPLVDKSTIFYLSRYEVDRTISMSNAHCTDKGYEGSHDTLIFQPPLSKTVIEQFPFELGTWYVEVKIIEDLTLANYTVRNVCKTVRSWHLHSSQGLSTGKVMGTIVSRLKSGGSWDPIIGSLINNCTFKYDVDALSPVVVWRNSMKQKSYDYRQDVLLSSLLGQSVQHVDRFAAFIQTIEYGFDLYVEYSDRFERFPSSGKIGHDFSERIEGIFQESFQEQTRVDKQLRQFFISDQLDVRAIDLVSGLLQQMTILLDDTNAPIWAASQARPFIVLPINDDRSFDTEKHEKKKKKILVSHYVSTEKRQRIAMEILLFPSICFTVTQLHTNSLLRNAASSEILCVLEHLMKCDLLECVHKDVKTNRWFTSVYIKQLPSCDHDEQVNADYRSIFDEKLKEFKYSHSAFTLDEYLKK
ncbi:unnamed protein product [Rotaria socialis]|nr:unnamed protein product [Rotaria socialis]